MNSHVNKKYLIKFALKTNNSKYLAMANKNLLYTARDVDPTHANKMDIFGYKLCKIV